MDAVFLKIINMSISAGWLIMAVVILRLIFKKASRRLICLLWILVAVRLICPFSPASRFSVLPAAQTISFDSGSAGQIRIETGITDIDEIANDSIRNSYSTLTAGPDSAAGNLIIVGTVVWLAGTAGLLVYAAVSYRRLYARIAEGLRGTDGIWLCDRIATPFVIGFIHPRICLPSSMAEEKKGYVIAHERTHLQRRDYLWKPLGFALLAIHWFNPLCWLAYKLFCLDIEFACDEKVISSYETGQRKAYSAALLSCSVSSSLVNACPLAFGEEGVKERIKKVLNYKKPSLWIGVGVLAAGLIVAICLLSDPFSQKAVFGHDFKTESIIYSAPQFDFTYSEFSPVPSYRISSDGQLQTAQSGNEDWASAGKLTNSALTADNFDQLFAGATSDDSKTIEDLRHSNKQAWQIESAS